jgi:CxxC-x17-CxxC domain-containing protein
MDGFRRREPRSGGRFSRKRQFSRGGFRSREQRKPRFSGAENPERETFEATCDKCGKQCSLPFKPTNSKPVYCRDCFKNKGNSETSSSSSQSAELEKINEKLGKIMRALHID